MKNGKDGNIYMIENMGYRLESDKSFDAVVGKLEKETAANKFRVLHTHDVQATLADKGLKREPLKIIEVCNANFAHEALQKDMAVSLFMPCRFVVHTEGGKTVVTLAKPSMIARMLPDSDIEQLAMDVEATLKKVMEVSV